LTLVEAFIDIIMHDDHAFTINLAAAALMFFYSEVLKLKISSESISRMKTGKDLPNVYSQADESKLLESASNPKHKLILMLVRAKKAKFNGGETSIRFGTVLPHIYWNRVLISAKFRFCLVIQALRPRRFIRM
jgi:hypothetical protein